MISFLGFLLVHLTGAAVLSGATRVPLSITVRSTTSAWLTLSLLGACALGWPGIAVIVVLAGSAYVLRGRGIEAAPLPGKAFLVFAGSVLARPWVPTQWDEFVWLAKARFESLGFGTGVAAALDPAQHVVPGGYPPLWPSAVGWLALGRDSLCAHVVAGSLLVLLAAASALQSVLPLLKERRALVWLVVLLAAPFAWVHVRSTYVDLPVGLLGLALLGRLLSRRLTFDAVILATVLAGLKDEGLALVVGATVGAFTARRSRDLWLPVIAAGVTVTTWRLLMTTSGVVAFDHAIGAPHWRWLPRFAQLLLLHATDVFTWGIFWAVVAAASIRGTRRAAVRPFATMLAVNLALMGAVLISVPERVREFAENGTLLNRLLMQLWPLGVAVLLSSAKPERKPDAAP